MNSIYRTRDALIRIYDISIISLHGDYSDDDVYGLAYNLGIYTIELDIYYAVAHSMVSIDPNSDRHVRQTAHHLLDDIHAVYNLILPPDTFAHTISNLIYYIVKHKESLYALYAYNSIGMSIDLYDPIYHTILVDKCVNGYVIQGIDVSDKFTSIHVPLYIFKNTQIRGGWFIPVNSINDFVAWINTSL